MQTKPGCYNTSCVDMEITAEYWALIIFFCPCVFITFFHRSVNMNPQMPQPTHSASAGQMLAQMTRQNGAPQTVTQPSTTSPLHGGPAGGWPGAGPASRQQFNNQVH